RRHTRFSRDWSSDVCSSDLEVVALVGEGEERGLVHGAPPWRLGAGLVPRAGPTIRHMACGHNSCCLSLCGIPKIGHMTLCDTERSEERRVGKEQRYRVTAYA